MTLTTAAALKELPLASGTVAAAREPQQSVNRTGCQKQGAASPAEPPFQDIKKPPLRHRWEVRNPADKKMTHKTLLLQAPKDYSPTATAEPGSPEGEEADWQAPPLGHRSHSNVTATPESP